MKRFAKTWLAVVVAAILPSLSGCNSAATATLAEYNATYEKVQELEKMIATTDLATFTPDKLRAIHEVGSELYYNFNPMDLKPEQITACEMLKTRVDALREQIKSKAEEALNECYVSAHELSDALIESAQTYPVYLHKGEKLSVTASSSKTFTLKVSNASSRTVLKSLAGKSSAKVEMDIHNTAIYIVEVIPAATQYIDLAVRYKVADISRLTTPTYIYSEQVECDKGDFGAKGVPGISMRKCFEEPRKFTLRGQLKAAFSGSAKALVAVQVPAGTTDILYSLRVATSESSRSDDGEFHDNLTRSYNRIKFAGLPIYERTSSNGLLNTLLDDNRPICEEDAYCNMYVFRSQKLAKMFQDGTKSASKLDYDVDYSTIGTQSCSGRIPTKGLRTIYLAFENERVRYTNYIWVEVEAVVPNTVYYTTKYRID